MSSSWARPSPTSTRAGLWPEWPADRPGDPVPSRPCHSFPTLRPLKPRCGLALSREAVLKVLRDPDPCGLRCSTALVSVLRKCLLLMYGLLAQSSSGRKSSTGKLIMSVVCYHLTSIWQFSNVRCWGSFQMYTACVSGNRQAFLRQWDIEAAHARSTNS